MNKTKVFFSIVIPALNEENYLPGLLEDLVKQSFSDFEVIVVDANSQDKTAVKAKEFSDKLDLKVINTPIRNVSVQRNMGAQAAQAEWILFMDADNHLPAHFLEGVKYQLSKNPQTDVFTTLLEVLETETVYKTIEQALNFGLIVIRLLDKPGAYGAFIGCRKSVFNTIKFEENLSFSEDGQFVNSCFAAGFHFSLFREPRFFYSMRRLKAEGTFKSLRISLPLLLRYAIGDDLRGVKSYVMEGGKYYDDILLKERSILSNVQKYIKTASKKQLNQARKILKSMRDLEF